MRTTSPAFEHETKKYENRPIELYQVYLDQGTLYLAAHDVNVPFFDELGEPVEYLALQISRGPITTNIETRVDECRVMLDNITRELSALVIATELRGRRLKIIKVFENLLNNPEHQITVFDGIMDEPVVTQEAAAVRVMSRLDGLNIRTPRRRFRRLCNWKFGSPECGVDLASVTVSGTVLAIGGDGRTFTLSGRNEPAGHYVDGVLTIGNEHRSVIGSNGQFVTVDYAFDEAKAGDSYTLRRGCNKTYDESCVGRFGNGARFGGFLSVPTEF